MSSPRCCELDEPHDGHEWTKLEPGAIFADYFYCWGVKASNESKRLLRKIELIDRHALALRAMLREEAEKNRRSESEFYEGDFDSTGKRLPLEPRKS